MNTSQYQLAYALTYLTFNGFHLVMFCHFKSFLNEMDEIIRTTTERGGKALSIMDFHIEWTEPDLVIGYRLEMQGATDNTRTQMFV